MTDVAHMYYNGAIALSEGTITWNSSTTNLYMALFTSGYTPVQASDTTYTSIAANELAASGGYSAGGAQIPSVANPVVSSSNIVLSSGNPSWGGASFTGVVTAVIYANAGAKPVLGFIEYGTAKAAQGGTFSVTCPTTGWFEWTPA
jgi:hypothetical protein